MDIARELHAAIQQARAQPAPGSPEAEAASRALLPETTPRHVDQQMPVDANGRPVEIPDTRVDAAAIIAEAAQGLNKRQRDVWWFCDCEGLSQERVGKALGISQRHVGRILAQAREELLYSVEDSIKGQFYREHRPAYFPPGYRPALPAGVEEARYRMEAAREVSTHIQADDFGFVEVWRNGDRQLDDNSKPIGKRTANLRAKVKRNRKIRAFRSRMAAAVKIIRAQAEETQPPHV